MIKRKEEFGKGNKYSYANPSSLFKKYFDFVSSMADATACSLAKENAQRRIAFSQEMHQLAKENSLLNASKRAGVRSNIPVVVSPLSTTESLARKSSFSFLSSVENGAQKIELKLFLSEMEEGRKKCELVFGHKIGADLSEAKRFGIQASKTRPDYYKRDLGSTITRGPGGWSEFVITYDNKFILESVFML